MVKSILKAALPPVLRKKLFLYYNILKRNTVDLVFFPRLEIPRGAFRVYREKNPFLELMIPVDGFPVAIRQKLSLWVNPSWTQDEYLLTYEGEGYIEPKTGWGMTMSYKLIYPSLGFANAPQVQRPPFFETYIRRKEVIRLKQILSLRDTGEENYFHFFNDVLPKLFFARDEGVNLADVTIVVSEKLWQMEYFQQVIKLHNLNRLAWHVQKKEWVRFERAVFCKPYTHTLKYLRQASLPLMPATPASAKRIFLTRGSSGLRYIENMPGIMPVLHRYGFEIVDTAQMSISAQAGLFYNCSYLIGIHGAGLTNMIFRQGHPLKVLEIVHPFPYIPFHYMMLAKLFNFQYNVIQGDRGTASSRGGFTVDPVLLDKCISKTL